MNILFVMRHAMYVRNYESTIRLLAERGHKVHLGFTVDLKKRGLDAYEQARELAAEYDGVSFGVLPSRRDSWWAFANQVRIFRDFLRYLHPRYSKAIKLAGRARKRLFPPARLVKLVPILRGPRGTAILSRVLGVIESAVPSDPEIEACIRSHHPDVVLVTPLVDLGSNQFDYLKSAKSIGLPAVLCVASWDNLTNKGLIQLEPDVVIVWNEAQLREAVELHGIPREKVVITGAQLYDHWFDMKASTTREAFCARVGLDPGRPFILYLCSSVFIARNEVDFVDRWIRELRACRSPVLRDAGVLIRPHPAHVSQWEAVDFSAHENVAIFPRDGAHPVNAVAKADYFDSLHHGIAAVGVNTSALIEAGIVGRLCFTVLAREFADTQGGTLHFSHLTEGGLLFTAQGFPEHFTQLERVLDGAGCDQERIRSFLSTFVRPQGIGVPCTPFVVQAIERAGKSRGTGPVGTPAWLLPLRWVLWPDALVARMVLGWWHSRRRAIRTVQKKLERAARKLRRGKKIQKLARGAMRGGKSRAGSR